MVNVFKKNCLLNPLFKKIFAVVFLLFASLISATASAALVFNAPAQDTDGNFTLSWSEIGTYAVLYENVNGTWQGLTGGSQVFSYTVTGKPEGSYVYKLDNFCQTGPYAPTACGSITRTVIVGTPAPTISAIGNVSMNEDTSQVINFTVGGLNQLTVSASSNNTSIISTSGLVLSGTGSARSLTVTPQVNASGSAEITLTVSDGIKSTPRTFTVSVIAVNDAPSISSIANTSINEGVANSGNLNFTIGDIDTAIGNLTVSATSSNTGLVQSSGLAITGTGTSRTLVVTPVARATGSSTITLMVSDGAMTSSTSFTFSVIDLPATLFINTTSTSTGNFTLSWDYAKESVKITESKDGGAEYPLPGYTEELSNKLSVDLNRSLSGVYKYTLHDCLHSGNQYGPITTCTPKNSKTITVTLPAPTVTASLNTTTINEGGTATLTWSSTNSNSCSATNISGVSATSGTATYTAPSVMSANQTKSFVVTCTGGGGSISTTLNLTVNWVNDSPVFSPSASVSTNEDTTFYIPFSVSDEETATSALTWLLTSSNQSIVANAGISVDLANNRLVVVPVANANGSVTLTARATDAGGAYSQKTIAVSIAGTNDAPSISSISSTSINEGVANSGNLNFTIGDIDTAIGNLTVSATSSNTGLVQSSGLAITGTGTSRTLVVTPVARATGSATITLTVSDGALSSSKSFTFSVVDLPATLFISATSSTTGNFTLSWDYAKESVKITESKDGGAEYPLPGYTGELAPKFSVNLNRNGSGVYKYTLHDCLHSGSQNGSIATCTPVDTKTITVTLPAPTVTASLNTTTINEGGNATLTWSSTNSNSCSATNISGVSATSGTATYTAPSVMSANQTKSFVVTCTGGGGSISTTLNLTVNWVNDSPVFSPSASVSANEDTTFYIPFSVSDEETATSALTWSLTSSNQSIVANAGISVNLANNRLVVVPVANANGSVTLTARVTDAGGAYSQKTIAVSIAGTNDAPSISSIANTSINEGVANSGNLNFTIGDIDTAIGNLTVSATSSNTSLVPSSGLAITGTGTARSLVVTPESRATGASTITLTVSDGALTSSKSFTFSVVDLPAALFINTTNSTTGNFTLNWDYAKETVKITESKDGGAEYPLPGYVGELPYKLSVDLNKSVNGVYKYTLHDCLHSGNQSGSFITCTPADTKTITVTLPAPTVTASLNTTTINEGGNATLTWSSTNSNNCSATNIAGVSAISGTATYTAPSVMSANQTKSFVVTCTGGGGSISTTLNLTVNWVNDSPVFSPSASVSANEDTTFYIPFSVSDEETATSALTWLLTSSNQSIVANAGISVDLVNKRLVVAPVANANGSVTLTARVTDANGAYSQKTIAVSIAGTNDAPSISSLANTTINEGVANSGNLNFTIGDIDTAIGNLTVSATSSNTSLVQSAGLAITGTGTSRTLVVTPESRATGLATITLTVSDGARTSSKTFTFSVIDLPAALFISTTNSTTGNFTLNWDYAKESVKITESKDGGAEYPLSGYTGELPHKSSVDLNKSANGVYKYTLHDCLHSGDQSGSFITCTPADTKTITVTLPAPTVTASLNTTTINEGGNATLTWSSTNSNSCSATNISGVSATSGTATYTAPSVMSANQTKSFVVTCTGGGGSISKMLNLTVNWVNDAPIISSISSKSIAEDSNTGAIAFTVNDEETSAASLSVSAVSDNQSVIPNGNIQLTNNGVNRTISLTPTTHQHGVARITIKVTDANGLSVETSFDVIVTSVDDAPVISAINNVTINELAETTVNFTVTDIDSSVSGVTVSSNATGTVTPLLSGSGNSYSVKLTAGTINIDSSTAQAQVTIQVPFSPNPVTRSFTVNVNNLDPQLWIEETGTIGVYDLHWRLATAAAQIYENGVDITTMMDPSGYAPVSGTKRITKSANGTFNYYIRNCVRATQGSFSCQGMYSPITKTVTFPLPTVTANFNKPVVNEANAGATNTTAELTWSSTNASSCTATGITGVSAISGNVIYTAPATLVSNQIHKVTVTCTGKGGSAQDETELTLTALNDQPTMSAIVSPVIANEDEAVSINFTVSDEETLAADLDVTTTSSNPELIPNSNLQLTANGANRSVVVTPLANQFGSAVIAVKVKDAQNLEFSRQFTVNVNAVDDAPVISDIPAITINEGATSEWQVFTVTDSDTASGLQVTATANGATLIPADNIFLVREGNAYKIAVKAGRLTSNSDSEITTVRIAVSGGSPEPATKSFQVKVNNLPAQLIVPELSSSGTYEVKWDFGTHGVRIFENGNDITTLINPSGAAPTSGSRVFVKTESGIYNYAIKDCVYGQNGSLVCDYISDSKSVQVSLSTPPAPVLNSPPTSNTGEYVVTWTVIPGVINYRLYENDVLIHNSGSTFKAFQSTNRKVSGTYQYTVKACILSCSELSNIQTTVVTIASSSSKSSSSSPSSSMSSKSSSSASAVNRRVIFIHTDLLGSPAAETNAEGNSNE